MFLFMGEKYNMLCGLLFDGWCTVKTKTWKNLCWNIYENGENESQISITKLFHIRRYAAAINVT